MVQAFVEKLCEELSIHLPKIEQKGWLLKLGDERVIVRDLSPGVSLQAQICEVPGRKKEDLYIYLMRANLLGQGTGGARIGLDTDEKFLTLSLGLPYELNYQAFRETVEDFTNYVIYWREEVAKFEREE